MNINGKKVGVPIQLLALFGTLLSASVVAAVWASDRHAELQESIVNESIQVENKVLSTVKEQYVPRHDFSRVEECLANQKKQVQTLTDKVEKMDSKIDDIHDVLIRQSTVQEIRQIQQRARVEE